MYETKIKRTKDCLIVSPSASKMDATTPLSADELKEFKARMQKYKGWIANITECPDFKMEDIENEVPFVRVIWPLESSQTMDSMFQGLHDASKELVDRLNSPLVDPLYRAYGFSKGALTFDDQVTDFLVDLCAQGSMEALDFCMSRGPSWMLTRDSTFPKCLAAAIEHNKLEMAQRLVTTKNPFGTGINFVQYVFGMTPFASQSNRYVQELFYTTRGRLCDAVRTLATQGGLEMIRWMIQFMSVLDVLFYIFYAALEIDAEDVVRVVYPIVKEVFEDRLTTTSKLIVRNNAISCAKALHELGTPVFPGDFHVYDACEHHRLMPMFRYLVEEVKLPVPREQLIVRICKRCAYSVSLRDDRALPQLEYLLTKYTYTEEEKNNVVRELLHDAVPVMLFKVLDSGFATPQFPELMAPHVEKHLRFKTKEGFLQYLQYGVPCDETTMCAVIGEPANAAIVLERGGEQVLTRKVWDTMIRNNYEIHQTVGGWFTSRGFAVDEQTLADAKSSFVLEWCLRHSALLTGNDAFYENIRRNNYINCHRLVEAGLKPTQEHLKYAEQVRGCRRGRRDLADAKNIIKIIEKNVVHVVLGKRKSRSSNPVYKT